MCGHLTSSTRPRCRTSLRAPPRVDVWIPLPQDDPYQEIITQRVDTPHGWTVYTEPEYGNKILHLTVTDADVRTIPVTLGFRVRRREHVQSLAIGTKVPVQPDQRWLQPDRLVPLDERIRSIAAAVTAEAETPLEKARAIYDYVVDTMVYDKSGTGWGNGDIYWACDVKTGNCTDFHALFVGLNRAVGIPATFEIGFPLPPDRSAGRIEGYHCWAQSTWMVWVGCQSTRRRRTGIPAVASTSSAPMTHIGCCSRSGETSRLNRRSRARL